MFSILLAICDFLSILISYCHTYACAKMKNIAKVQDEICKVEGMLEELGMRLQEDVKKMPEVEKTQLCKKEEFFWKEKNML